MSYSCHF